MDVVHGLSNETNKKSHGRTTEAPGPPSLVQFVDEVLQVVRSSKPQG
jgi:hypothetical protein